MWKDVVELRIAIGVPTLNNFRGLAELFASLWGEEYTPLVVSNWVDNIGVSRAWNEILRTAILHNYDLVLIVNDDVVFRPSSFKSLVASWDDRPQDAIMVTGCTDPEVDMGFAPAPDYSCFMVDPLNYVRQIGWFDENFTPAYFEDNDSHYRIKVAGYEAYRFNGATIMHKGSQTQNANPNTPIVTPPMFEKNRAYYVEKWGGRPGEEKLKVPYGDTSKDWKYWRDC